MPALTLLLHCTLAVLPGDPASSPPQTRNVLVVILDDLGVDRVAAYGSHPDAGPTPVLDQLAAEGLLFRNACSDPLCSPTRTTILQGQYNHVAGVGTSIPWDGDQGEAGPFTPAGPMLPERLAGRARTAAIGKWHLDTLAGAGYDAAVERGFELYRGHPAGHLTAPDSYHSYLRVVADASGYSLAVDRAYVTTREVDDALAVIREFGAAPWFVWLALHAPHAPFQPPPGALHSFGDLSLADDTIVYRAMIEAADAEIGRLLASMHPRTLAHTTVILLGDNGTPGAVTTPPTDQHKAKGKLYQGGVHVPLVIWGAGVADPGREVLALVNTVDLFQTVLDLLGAGDGGRPDSISLVPYLRSADASPQRTWVHARRHSPNGLGPYDDGEEQGMVRDERHKLIRRTTPEGVTSEELYDLQHDPFETSDLLAAQGLTSEQIAALEALGALLDDLGGPPSPTR